MTHVAILTPAHSGMLHADHAQAVAGAVHAIEDAGMQASWHVVSNIASVTKARNALVSGALHDGADELIFIDSDIAFHPTAILRLLSHDVDFIGVPQQTGPMTRERPFPFALFTKGGRLQVKNGIAEVDAVSTAMLRMRGRAMRELARLHEDLRYYESHIPGAEEGLLVALFDYRLTEHPDDPQRRKYWGEDYAFCRLAREAGYQIYADMLIPVEHTKRHAFNTMALHAMQAPEREGGDDA